MKKLIKTIIIIIAVSGLDWLMIKDLAITGQLEFTSRFLQFTPFVSILVPEERTEISDQVNIEQEPVYFDIFLPRDFANINLAFEFANQQNQLIEVGAQTGESAWQLQPLYHRLLSELDWPQITADNLILWQRQPAYDSLDDFLTNLPPINQIASYNFDLPYDYFMPDYQPSAKLQELSLQLEGNYQFYTYVKDEDLAFTIMLDAPGQINLYDLRNQLIDYFSSQADEIVVFKDNLPEGAFKLELQTEPETITRRIVTQQQYISFLNTINLLSPAELVTNSQNLTLITYNDKGKQVISFADQELKIDQIWQQYKLVSFGLSTLKIPEGYLQITGQGLFSFSQNQFFDPLITKVGPQTDLSGINYVIADYNLPSSQKDFKINSVDFSLPDKEIKKGKLRFVISVPGVSENNPVIIHKLTVKLTRPAIWQDGVLKNLFNYLRFYKNEIIK